MPESQPAFHALRLSGQPRVPVSFTEEDDMTSVTAVARGYVPRVTLPGGHGLLLRFGVKSHVHAARVTPTLYSYQHRSAPFCLNAQPTELPPLTP